MQYFGGKCRIASALAQHLNTYSGMFTCAVDLFCGSLNVGSRLQYEHIVANDSHPYLMAMWEAVQVGWVPPRTVSEEEYNRCRQFPDADPPLTGFVGFGCSFAGKWFGGYARSGTRNYALNAHNSVMRKAAAVKPLTLMTGQWFDCVIPSGALVYADVPYRHTTAYSMLTGGFDWLRFMDWARTQQAVLISEYLHNVPSDGHVVWSAVSKQDIRNRGKTKTPTTEVLFTFNEELL